MSKSSLNNPSTSIEKPFDADKLTTVVDDLIREARAQGASASEAGLSAESGLSVTVRMGEVETIEHNRDKGLGITVFFWQKKGCGQYQRLFSQSD